MFFNVFEWFACLSYAFLYFLMLVGATRGLINLPFNTFSMLFNVFPCCSMICMPFLCVSILSDTCWSNPRINKPSICLRLSVLFNVFNGVQCCSIICMPSRCLSILSDAWRSNSRINKPSRFCVFYVFKWRSMFFNVFEWFACLSDVFLYFLMLVGATRGFINLPFSLLSDAYWSHLRIKKPSFFCIFYVFRSFAMAFYVFRWYACLYTFRCLLEQPAD